METTPQPDARLAEYKKRHGQIYGDCRACGSFNVFRYPAPNMDASICEPCLDRVWQGATEAKHG